MHYPRIRSLIGLSLLGAVSLLGGSTGWAWDYQFTQSAPTAFLPLNSSATSPSATQTPAVTTQDEVFERSQWQLSEIEWQRYLGLMKGIRGSISPRTLSPIEVLGIHAETAQERKKYATQWAKLMRDDVERTLAFQRAYTEAAQSLYGQNPIMNLAQLPVAGSTLATAVRQPPPQQPIGTLQEGDRLLLFLKINACQQCSVVAEQVLSISATQKVQVDLYFVDTQEGPDDASIIAWAKQHQLDTQRLAQKILTLNHDKGTLSQVSGNLFSFTDVPLVYLLRQNQLIKVSVS